MGTPCFIERDGTGKVVGVYANEQPDFATEASTDDAADVIAYFLARSAAPALAEKLAAGIAITSTATPALDATYALDPTTLDQIGSVARDAGAGLGLPGGLSSFAYPDATGAPHSFSATDIAHLYKAMRDLVFALNEQAAVAEAGGSPSWPAQIATIA